MSARGTHKALLTLGDDADRLDDARRTLLADWCRLVGRRLNGQPIDTAAAAAAVTVSPGGETNDPPRGDARTASGLDHRPDTDRRAGGVREPGTPVEAAIAALDLPPRMAQVLTGLLAGASEKQLAYHLSISPHTVHTYVKQLHKRLNVSSRGELLARFVG